MAVITHTTLVLLIKIITTFADDLIEQVCLDCLCQTYVSCGDKPGCFVGSDNVKYCGPYDITKPYWIDGGRLRVDDDDDDDDDEDKSFEKCSVNKDCADKTIRRYMNRYKTDCNSNGNFDCSDVYKIHKIGFTGCVKTDIETTEKWLRFLECYLNNSTDPRRALNSIKPKNK
ncbi:lysozyme-like [Centruroides vittatus]|uniref:lysozyme-like n=1 Tax=Centruroides vittatus TaxID=120091 RepID=UPI00350FB8E1